MRKSETKPNTEFGLRPIGASAYAPVGIRKEKKKAKGRGMGAKSSG
jgi:hypothetical protein